MRNRTSPSYVYVIGSGDGKPVKVGVASDPDQRLRNVNTHNACRHDLVYLSRLVETDSAYHAEMLAHSILGEQVRLQGEWFAVAYGAAISAVVEAVKRVGRPAEGRAPPALTGLAPLPVGYRLNPYPSGPPLSAAPRLDARGKRILTPGREIDAARAARQD